MATWTQKQTMDLITTFEQYPNLYKIYDSEYKNRTKRRNNLKEIADKIKSIRPTTTVKDIVLKLKTLKTQFLKEKAKIINSKRSGAGTEQLYVPKLWCYNDLHFWEDTSDDISGTSNISVLPRYFKDTKRELDILNGDGPSGETTNRSHSETECCSLPSTSTAASSYSRKPRKTTLELRVREAAQATNRNVDDIANKPLSALRPFLNNLEYEMNILTNEDLLTETRW